MASGPESLSPPGQGEKKQRGLGSIPHIARTLLAKPGRRLAPVVIFNSGAWASCHVRHASWARSQASSGRHTPSPNCPVPFAGSYEASSSITSHHPSRPLSTAVPAGSPAQFGSALLCPAAPVSSWTLFVIAGRCCVLGTARMPTGPLPGIMPACAPCFASQTSMCRQVKYDTRRCVVFWVSGKHTFDVINHIGCVLPSPKYVLATALLELGIGPLYSTAPLRTMCPDNSTANSRQVQKAPHCMYLTATTHHLKTPSRTARGTPFHPPSVAGHGR